MNKMEFPKIKKSEYAVLMADSNGVILDIYFDIYYKSSNQIVYKVFSSLPLPCKESNQKWQAFAY